jgi:hypothetical protein
MSRVRVRPAYPLKGFCQDFGVGLSTAYAEIRAGRLKAFKVGDRTMVAGEDALAWRDRYREAGYRRAAYPAAA